MGCHDRVVRYARVCTTRTNARGRLIGGHEHKETDPTPWGRSEPRTSICVLAQESKAQVQARVRAHIICSIDEELVDQEPIEYFEGSLEPAWVPDVSEYERCFSTRLQDRYGHVLHCP